jgi:hypothetical protein
MSIDMIVRLNIFLALSVQCCEKKGLGSEDVCCLATLTLFFYPSTTGPVRSTEPQFLSYAYLMHIIKT